MRTSKNTERSLRLATTAAVRQKNIADYFLKYSQAVRPWLKELAEKYKAKGDFPMMPMAVLPSYYTDARDKEIALFAGLLITESNFGERNTECAIEKMREFRELLGDKPWEWFEKREFVRLGIGRTQDKRTGGVLNWKIANLFGRLWDECHFLTYEIPSEKTKQTLVQPTGVQVEMIAKARHCSYFDVLTYLAEDCGVGDYSYKLRLLLMVACTGDGVGLSLWENHNVLESLQCPLVKGLRQFLQTWFPDYLRYGSMDDAIHLFGFERDCDFLYAYLAYKELQTRNPKVCSMFSTTYLRWYDMGVRKKPYQFRRLLPEIKN